MVKEADKKSELEKSRNLTEAKNDITEKEKLLRTRMSKVKHKIAIISGNVRVRANHVRRYDLRNYSVVVEHTLNEYGCISVDYFITSF
jgi:hypothetical protein